LEGFEEGKDVFTGTPSGQKGKYFMHFIKLSDHEREESRG